MASISLISIGEVMAEIRGSRDSDFALGFAGDTYNTCFYAARAMGDKSDGVSYITRIGKDSLSGAFMVQAKRDGVDVSGVAVDAVRNIGIYSVSTDDKGERSFHYWRSDSAARRMFTSMETTPALPSARVIYLSGITLAILTPQARTRLLETLLAKRSKEGAMIAFDSNYRPGLWEDTATACDVMDRMWAITDIALPSIDDEMALRGDSSEQAVIDRFAGRRWEGIAIKRGAKGPISSNLSQDDHPKFVQATKVVDTTAAGDSFNGGYLAACLSGAEEAERLLAGHDLAARVVGHPGAIIVEICGGSLSRQDWRK